MAILACNTCEEVGFFRVGVALALYDVGARVLHIHLLIDVAMRAMYVHAEELTHESTIVIDVFNILGSSARIGKAI